MNVMNVTEVKLYKPQKDGIVKAFGKATLEDMLSLDVLIMDKGNGDGPWATFPNGKTGSDGKWYVPVFWKSKELDKTFKDKVVEAYHAQMSGGFTQPKAAAPAADGNASTGSESLPF